MKQVVGKRRKKKWYLNTKFWLQQCLVDCLFNIDFVSFIDKTLTKIFEDPFFSSVMVYLTIKSFWVLIWERFFMFLKEVIYAHQGSIYLIKYSAKTVIFWNIITISSTCFLREYALTFYLFQQSKAEFSASFLQSSASHDPSILFKYADLLMKCLKYKNIYCILWII